MAKISLASHVTLLLCAFAGFVRCEPSSAAGAPKAKATNLAAIPIGPFRLPIHDDQINFDDIERNFSLIQNDIRLVQNNVNNFFEAMTFMASLVEENETSNFTDYTRLPTFLIPGNESAILTSLTKTTLKGNSTAQNDTSAGYADLAEYTIPSQFINNSCIAVPNPYAPPTDPDNMHTQCYNDPLDDLDLVMNPDLYDDDFIGNITAWLLQDAQSYLNLFQGYNLTHSNYINSLSWYGPDPPNVTSDWGYPSSYYGLTWWYSYSWWGNGPDSSTAKNWTGSPIQDFIHYTTIYLYGSYMGVGSTVECSAYINEVLSNKDPWANAGSAAATTLTALLPTLLSFGNVSLKSQMWLHAITDNCI